MRLLELLIKGAGHKYIKRIPVGTTKTGRVRYRYIYSATHTVGGKHLLDEAHLKPGAKLMLHSKDGAEVHAHIESVKGDQVTFTYDDGERKGESRTVSKQQLLAEFNKEHKVGEQIDSAKAALLADIRAAGEKGFSKKQLARLVARLERLGGSVDKETKPKETKPKETKPKETKPKEEKPKPKEEKPKPSRVEFDTRESRILQDLSGVGERLAESQLGDINAIRARSGMTVKELLAASTTKQERLKGERIGFTLPNGDQFEVGHLKGRNYVTIRPRQGGELDVHVASLKGSGKITPSKLARAAMREYYLGNIRPGQMNRTFTDGEKRLKSLGALEAYIPRVQALAEHKPVLHRDAGDEITAPTQPAASYAELPQETRKMLDKVSAQKPYSRKTLADRPYAEVDGTVTATDGISMFNAPVNTDNARSAKPGFDKSGQAIPLSGDAPPTQELRTSVDANTSPAFTIPADTARTLATLINKVGATANNTEQVMIKQTGDQVRVEYLGQELATFQHITGEKRHPESVALKPEVFSLALSAGASTFHLDSSRRSNKQLSPVKVTSTAGTLLAMPVRR